jgi:hypothetical protein
MSSRERGVGFGEAICGGLRAFYLIIPYLSRTNCDHKALELRAEARTVYGVET